MTGSEHWSKVLFNNSHLLGVAAAIARSEGEVDSQMLQGELAIAQSTAQRALRVFEDVRLLERLERTSRTAVLRYRRAPHAFWDTASTLHREAEHAA